MRASNVPEGPGLTRRRLLATTAAGAGALALTAAGVGAASPAMAAWPKGLDSNQDPNAGQVASAGYVFVSYYLTGPGAMTAGKVAACAAAGVAVIANFEQAANPTGRGSAGGSADARTALSAADACGIPADRPIYFSLDFDVQPSQYAAVDAYLDGIASVLPRSRIGIYSSTWCIDHVAGNGKAAWFWQSMSGGFSGGRNATLNSRTHIWQRGSATVGGAGCDWDYATTADYGHWAARSAYAGDTQLVALGNNGDVYHDIRHGNGAWQGWSGVKGAGTAAAFHSPEGVAIAGAKGGSAQLVAIGNDYGLYHDIRHTDGTWQGWVSLNLTASQCAIAAMPDGSAQVLAVDGNASVTHNVRSTPSGTWQGFSEVPRDAGTGHFQVGTLYGASHTGIAITGMPDGSSQLLALGTDNNIYHNIRYSDRTWQGFRAVKGAATAATFSGPAFAIAGMPDGAAQLLAVGYNGGLYHNIRYGDDTWQGFRSLGFDAQWVAAAALPDGSMQVLAVGNDGNIYHNIRYSNDTWQGFQAVKGAATAATFNGTYPGIAGFPWG